MRFGPLIIAIGLAAVAGFIALKMIGTEPAPEPVVQQSTTEPSPTANVYLASQFIPIGTVITTEMLQTQPWPENLITASFVTDEQSPDTLIGKISRASFQPGEPIALTKLAEANNGSFVAGALPKGMRAVSINTDETLGVAGFVFPGDRVDILMTHQVPKIGSTTENAQTEQITETLLTNVPVLAVDQVANAQEVPADDSGGQASTIHVARTVTVMVNPVDGQKLRLGEKIGQLSMALRSVEDRETVDMAALLRYQNITQYPVDAASANTTGPADDGVRIIRGTEAANVAPISLPSGALSTLPTGMMANPLIPTTAFLQPPTTTATDSAAAPSVASASSAPAVVVSGTTVVTPAPETAPTTNAADTLALPGLPAAPALTATP